MPGGGLEPEEEPRNAAIREVEEEAGVLGKLGRCLGVFEVRVNLQVFPALFACFSISFINSTFINILR